MDSGTTIIVRYRETKVHNSCLRTLRCRQVRLNKMAVKRNLLVSVLQLTKNGPVEESLVSRCAHSPIQVTNDMLKSLSDAGLIKLNGKKIEVSLDQRVRIAMHAMKLGADFESVCSLLEWNEFERISAIAFEFNHFNVTRGLRFKSMGRRWEIDVVGCKEPIIVCADCKHWHRGWTKSAIMKAADAQIERTKALAKAFPSVYEKLGLDNWKEAKLVPMILSLFPTALKFHQNIPVVPILQLQNLLNELLAHVDSLTRFLVHL